MFTTAQEARRVKMTRNRLKAMSHPLRARALRLLVERGVSSPAELARSLETDVRTVGYHVRQLQKLECAELVETRPNRGAVEHFYRATELHLIDTDEWEELEALTAGDLVCEFVQRILDDFVASRKAGIVGSDKHFHITRTPVILDRQGFQEGMESHERCRLEMADIEARSRERLANSGEAAIPASSDHLLFKVPRMSLDR